MNIHITDQELNQTLTDAALAKIEVGSPMYGLNDELSDVDYLSIFMTPKIMLESVLNTHHQFQYKDEVNNIDYNYTSLHTFISNALNGDSTINYEVIQSGCLLNTPLSWLHDCRHMFNNYSIIRSYLGICRRDGKYYHKATDHRSQIKKILHIYRGYFFAKSIMENNFKLINNDLLSIASDVRKIEPDNYTKKKKYLNESLALVSDLRDKLNTQFNSPDFPFPKFVKPENFSIIDREVYKTLSSYKNLANNLNEVLNMEILYTVYENWVQYD